MSGNDGRIRLIYPAITWGGITALAFTGHLYINAVFFKATEAARLENRVDNIERVIKDNTVEQKKTQDVIQRLIIKLERDEARREGVREGRERTPTRSPREDVVP